MGMSRRQVIGLASLWCMSIGGTASLAGYPLTGPVVAIAGMIGLLARAGI
jgi:hypothetical protein